MIQLIRFYWLEISLCLKCIFGNRGLPIVLVDHLQKLQKIKQTGDSRYIYKNELDKACFQHDMIYGDFKDLKKGTAADKVLRDKAFNIAKKSPV